MGGGNVRSPTRSPAVDGIGVRMHGVQSACNSQSAPLYSVSRSVVLCPGDTGVCCVQKWTQNCDRRHTIYDTIRRTYAQETDASSQLDLPRGIKDKKTVNYKKELTGHHYHQNRRGQQQQQQHQKQSRRYLC